MTESIDTLILGGMILTIDPEMSIIKNGAIAVRGSTIVGIGPAEEMRRRFTAEEVVDCSEQVIMPGMVNAHTHVPMTLLRGLNDDLRLDVWLGYLMPLEREFVTPDFVQLGTTLACAEMIRSGVTTFADMYYFEDDIAARTAEIGMRALLGHTVLMFPAPDAKTYIESISKCRQFIENWQGHPLIQPAVPPTPGIPQPPTCSRHVPISPSNMMFRSTPISRRP